MAEEYFSNDSVHMYVSELTSRIVAESGIPSDRFHLGKIILQSLKDDPDFLMQIDGATGITETHGSMLERSVRCAMSLKSMGLQKDDVMVLMAPSHLDLAVPFYAGWYNGLAVAPADRTMNVYDLKHFFDVVRPKIVFCQSEKVEDIQETVNNIGLDTIIVTFDKTANILSLSELLEKYEDTNVEQFKATDINPESTIALLVSTSGTTGRPKAAAITHKNMAVSAPYLWSFSTKFPSPTQSVLLVAPIQWLSTIGSFVLSPYMKYTRIQTSELSTPHHMFELIKKYKPTFFILSPTLLATLTKIAVEEKCDFTNFQLIYVGGSAVSIELVKQIKTMSPKTIVQDTYAMTELASMGFQSVGAPIGSCGKRMGHLQYRLVDVDTKQDIKEPNKCGELWLKGPGIFKGYYNNPKATEELFAEGQWLMTGDLMYRDDHWNYYFVDRIKSLLKYRNHQISPVEVEAVIRQHSGVLDVAVTGVPDPDCGDLCVACVVRRPGWDVTKQEIKELVKENLSDSKQLRGGVMFVDELPLTPTTKLHRTKLKEIVMKRINELDSQKD